MFADQLARMARRWRAMTARVVMAACVVMTTCVIMTTCVVMTACVVMAGLLVPAAVAQAAARHAPASKHVSFLGYTFAVPRSWPVINDAGHPHRCVRFDVHAVYLGVPGANQSCPSWLFGTTEAILIQPGRAGAARVSQEDPTAREITVTAPRISMLATFATDPTQIYRILASASLPAPEIRIPNPAQPGADGAPALTAGTSQPDAGRGSPDLSSVAANYHGLGFDACTAPSAGYMAAWRRSSPYRAVGIYIGGADRACDQHNLTRSWVMLEARAGWRFIPMYAGPQAAFGELHRPAGQGRRAAADAVAQAQRLGFGRQTPLYYDMEAYPAKDTGAALHFLSAWTIALHELGYESGVYSSSRSGIVDLARQYSRRSFAMPDVIYDALWNGSPNTTDKSFSRGEWADHRRIHQYRGNVRQTYGHDTIDIDQDYLDVNLPVPDGTPQASQAVSLPGGAVDVFYKGTRGALWREAYSPVFGWARPASMVGDDSSVPSAVSAAAGTIDVFYKGTDRNLWEVSLTPGHGWGPARRLAGLGILGGAPRAVAQANGVIDVFWRGAPKRHLWHARFVPGHGWSGRQLLGGGLASYPSPVEAEPGTVEVFWTGADRSLWHVISRDGGSWSRQASLGMGPLGGAVHATAQASGSVEVVWRGLGRHHVWAALGSPGGWRGPVNLGGNVAGSPWPDASSGPVRVLWRGRLGALWDEQRAPQGGWTAPVRLRLGRSLSSAPFTPAGSAGGALWVFWKGRAGALWSVSVVGTSGQPRNLGGHIA